MKQIIPALCRRSALAIVVVGSSLVPGQNKAGSGTTSDSPGAQPTIHLVAPVADGQWTMPAGIACCDIVNRGASYADGNIVYNRGGQIFGSIAHGRSYGMPAWGTRLPPKQIRELVASIKSPGTAPEPDPPQEPADETEANPQHYDSTNPGTPIFIVGSTR